MIVSITGSRTITDYKLVAQAAKESGFKITEIISGGAGGVDTVAEIFAKINGIPFKEYPADWKTFGKRAGHLRNGTMSEVAEAAIVVWNGVSKGTADYIKKIEALGKPLYLKKVENKKYSKELK